MSIQSPENGWNNREHAEPGQTCGVQWRGRLRIRETERSKVEWEENEEPQ